MNEQIEAIRNEIERVKKDILSKVHHYPIHRIELLDDLLSFLDTLSEEPAPKGYDEAYLNERIAKASKTWKGVDVDKYMDEVRGNRPKLSDGSLEDEMINYWGRIPEDKDLVDTARHFALWQKKQMMEEWLEDRGGCFFDGVNEGKKAMKEQMLKEAVEGVVIKTYKHTSVRYKSFYGTDRYFYGIADKQFKPGDKVWISIVKEDNQ